VVKVCREADAAWREVVRRFPGKNPVVPVHVAQVLGDCEPMGTEQAAKRRTCTASGAEPG
jgi:hypothetical protein